MMRSFFTVMSGTMIAQVLGLLLLPVISRIYSPFEFGEYQVIASAVIMLVPLAGFKMEFAILRLRASSQLASLITLCLLLNLATTILLVLVVEIAVHLLGHSYSNPTWASWKLPVFFLVAGVYQTLSYLLVRNSRYKVMSTSKIAQTVVFHGGSAITGLFVNSPTSIWLVFWDVASRVFGSIIIFHDWINDSKSNIQKVTWNKIKKLFRVYRYYPMYSLPSSFVGSLVGSSPVFFINYSYGILEAGQYGMAWRVVMLPLSMIIYGLSQVVTSDLSKQLRTNTHGVEHRILLVVRNSLLVSILPVLVIYAVGAEITPLILGEEWVQAGHMIVAMIPMIIASVVYGPINMLLIVMRRPRLQLFWELSRAFLVCFSFWLSVFNGLSVIGCILAISIAMLLTSFLFVALALISAKRTKLNKYSNQ